MNKLISDMPPMKGEEGHGVAEGYPARVAWASNATQWHDQPAGDSFPVTVACNCRIPITKIAAEEGNHIGEEYTN